MFQNLSGFDAGGGDVKYSVDICVISADGCALKCTSEGENEVGFNRDISSLGPRT